MPSSLPLAFPLHSQSPGLMHSQGEPHCPALGSLCPPPAARMALLCFWFASFCLPFFWVPGWPPFLSLPSGEGSKAFCQEEEHVPCHCCMHPGPVTLCASPAACGAGCQEGTGRTFQDRGSRGCDPGQGWGVEGWEGAGRPWKLTCFHYWRGTDRADGTRVSLDAVLKPSGWLSEVRLGGGLSSAILLITLALIRPAISRCSVNTWC